MYLSTGNIYFYKAQKMLVNFCSRNLYGIKKIKAQSPVCLMTTCPVESFLQGQIKSQSMPAHTWHSVITLLSRWQDHSIRSVLLTMNLENLVFQLSIKILVCSRSQRCDQQALQIVSPKPFWLFCHLGGSISLKWKSIKKAKPHLCLQLGKRNFILGWIYRTPSAH